MGYAPSRKEVRKLLAKLSDRVKHEECFTCDCLQGFLMQLQLDVDEDMSDLFELLEVPRESMHPCMGCDPCVPGALYAEYILKQEGGRNRKHNGALNASM